MTIDKIGGLGSNYEPIRPVSIKKTEIMETGDQITISEKAMQKAQEASLQSEIAAIAKKVISLTPEQDRTEKVKDIKQKLKNGEYDELSPKMLDQIAERITESFLS